MAIGGERPFNMTACFSCLIREETRDGTPVPVSTEARIGGAGPRGARGPAGKWGGR